MFRIIKKKNGFSLIEIMLVITIIGILAGVVLGMNWSQYREKGMETKALAQLSSAIQPMISCWSDGNKVYFPSRSGGADICRDGTDTATSLPSYGQWPNMDEYYNNGSGAYLYDISGIENVVLGSDADWAFYVQFSSTSSKICCNKRNKKCAIIPSDKTCDNSLDLTRYD